MGLGRVKLGLSKEQVSKPDNFIDKQACAVDNCYRIDCGSYGICKPNERREEDRVVSSWTCQCSGGYR